MPVGLERNLASCCMCFSIRTGCKIIGMLSLFFSAMHFVIYTMMLIQVESNLPRCYEMLERGETNDHLLLNNCFQHSIWLVRAALLLGCLLYLFGLIGSAMLLKGISKKSPKLFYAWFLFCTVIIVRNLMSYGTFHDVNEGMKNLLFCLVLLYFFCIVKFHERELIGIPEDVYGLSTTGNTAMQEVVTTYPGQSGLPKDNPPPYSVVVDCAPPPYSACAPYLPEHQSTNQSSTAAPTAQVIETTITENANRAEQDTVPSNIPSEGVAEPGAATASANHVTATEEGPASTNDDITDEESQSTVGSLSPQEPSQPQELNTSRDDEQRRTMRPGNDL